MFPPLRGWIPPKHDMYDQCTLYDCVNQFGYTIEGLLGNYPIWDESKRSWLNSEIYEYFEYREIASETPKLFSSYAQRTMNRVMPKVNSIAAFALSGSENWSQTLTDTTDVTSESSTENAGSASSSTTYGHTQTETPDLTNTRTPDLTNQTDTETESKATALMSDTPQVQLSGTENYMSSLNESGSSGTTGTTATQTGTETTTQTGTDTTTMTGTDTTANENSSTSETTNTGETTHLAQSGQLSELASNWANTMPDLLGLIFESLEVCFMQVI